MTLLEASAFATAAAGGAISRYLIESVVQARSPRTVPIGTFIVNVTGCLLLGLVAGLGLYHDLGASVRTVLGTGALGAYTTFSTFAVQAVRLVQLGHRRQAGTYVAITVVGGTLAAAAGLAIGALTS